MISFKQYLEEAKLPKNAAVAWNSTNLTPKKAAELVATHCTAALAAFQKGKGLYRGFGGSDIPLVLLDTENSIRASKDISNLYQLAHDASENTKHIPSRSNSLICTTDKWDARQFGRNHGHMLFPYDGYAIAVGDQSDMHNSFINSTLFSGEYRELDEFLVMLARAVGVNKSKYWEYESINKALSHYSPDEFALMYLSISDSEHMSGFMDHIAAVSKDEEESATIEDLLDDLYPRAGSKIPQQTLKSLAKIMKSGKAKPYLQTKKAYDLLVAMPSKKRFEAIASAILHPKSNNVKVTYDPSTLPNDDVECWVAGKVVAIPFGHNKFSKQCLEFLAALDSMGIETKRLSKVMDLHDEEDWD